MIHVKDWIEAGITKVNHLMDARGNFLSFHDFKQKFSNVTRTDFLTYEGIIRSIKRYQTSLNYEEDSPDVIDDENKVWTSIKKGNKEVKSIMLGQKTTPAAVGKWNSIYTRLKWKDIFLKPLKTTIDTKLRWFQFRLIHRILPTQKFLHMCKLTDTALCNFCNSEAQTIQHLFWNCHVVQKFWNDLESLLQNKCLHTIRINLSEQLILFGCAENVVTDKALDFIIIFAKFFVYKC